MDTTVCPREQRNAKPLCGTSSVYLVEEAKPATWLVECYEFRLRVRVTEVQLKLLMSIIGNPDFLRESIDPLVRPLRNRCSEDRRPTFSA